MNLLSKAVRGVKKIAGNVEKATVKGVKDVTKAEVKAVKDTGHAVGSAAKSNVGQALIGVAIASTGVGLVAGAAIGAGVKAGATLAAPHGNLRKAGGAAVKGAELGAGAVTAGAAVRTVKNGGGLGGFASRILHGKDASVPLSSHPITAQLPSARPVPVVTDPELPVMPLTESGIVPTTMKERPVDAAIDTLVGGVTRKKPTPSDTHGASRKNSSTPEVVQAAQPVIDQSSGGGGGGLPAPVADAPKFSPMAAVAAVAAAIVVGMFAVRKKGAR